MLEQLVPTAVVRVNRAVAVAEAVGPEAGLAVLDTVEGADDWHHFHSARAELLHRCERDDEAVASFERALECRPNDVDRRFLEERLAALRAGPARSSR